MNQKELEEKRLIAVNQIRRSEHKAKHMLKQCGCLSLCMM